MEISGKTAIVTGAASGIGLAIATSLAEAGANVVLADIEKDAVEQAAHALSGTNKQVLPVRIDVTSERSVIDALAEAVTHVFQVVRTELNGQLESLRDVIARAALDNKELLALKAEIDALIAEGKAPPKTDEAAKKGDGWFERVGKFAETATKILKAVDAAAGPLGKIVKWVAPLAPAAAAFFGLV